MQRRKRILFFCIIMVFGLISMAHSTTINYGVNDLGGGKWEYDYTVLNDTLGSPIDEFTIYFDYGLYDNLSVTTPVADWDELTVNPVLILGSPETGFYDALAFVAGIAPGSSMSGFSVAFDWLGSGTPGSQFFEFVDPATFGVLDSGLTTVTSSPVPEPGTMMLLGSGIAALLCFRRKITNS